MFKPARIIVLLVLALSVLITACSSDTATQKIELVSPSEATEVIADAPEGLVVLDIRTAEEFDQAHLADAIMVDYYADGGRFEDDRALVSDAKRGFQQDQKSTWIPPAAPGPVRLWAVARDNRGGMAVASAMVLVE